MLVSSMREGDKITGERSGAAFPILRTYGVNRFEGRLDIGNLDT